MTEPQAPRCNWRSLALVPCTRTAECSRWECPMRKPLTAGPPDLTGKWHFHDEDARRWPSRNE